METFVWDRHFDTGLEIIDKQHHHLVDLVNVLGNYLIERECKDDEALNKAFVQLAQYADYHFSEEERLMNEAGVDEGHTRMHFTSHRSFMEQVGSMWSSRDSILSTVNVLHKFLVAWLSFHILGVDQVLARQLKLITAGCSPKQAFSAEAEPHDNATSALLTALDNLYHILSEQNSNLANANQLLEQRIAKRTEELEQANMLLEKVSRTEALLGISNRLHFNETFEREWHRSIRERIPLSLLMIDVDYFKLYNDHYGHLDGDDCLRKISQAIKSSLKRATDMLARYGGEELVVILPNTINSGARVVAQNLLNSVRAIRLPHAKSPINDIVTISIGVATMVPERGTESGKLIAAADQALYSAKALGRNCIDG